MDNEYTKGTVSFFSDEKEFGFARTGKGDCFFRVEDGNNLELGPSGPRLNFQNLYGKFYGSRLPKAGDTILLWGIEESRKGKRPRAAHWAFEETWQAAEACLQKLMLSENYFGEPKFLELYAYGEEDLLVPVPPYEVLWGSGTSKRLCLLFKQGGVVRVTKKDYHDSESWGTSVPRGKVLGTIPVPEKDGWWWHDESQWQHCEPVALTIFADGNPKALRKYLGVRSKEGKVATDWEDSPYRVGDWKEGAPQASFTLKKRRDPPPSGGPHHSFGYYDTGYGASAYGPAWA